MRKNGRTRLYLAMTLALVASAALVAAACGSSNEEEEPSPTASSPRLEEMVLSLADLPPWMRQATAAVITNEDAVAGLANDSRRLREFQGWGRLLGYARTFLPVNEGGPTGVTLGVESEVNLFDSPAGARLAFDDLVEQAKIAIEALEAEDPDTESTLIELQIDEIEANTIGVDRYWVRTSRFLPGDEPVLRVDNQVVFLVGSVQAFLRADAVIERGTDRTAFTDEVREWGELMTERMESGQAVADRVE